MVIEVRSSRPADPDATQLIAAYMCDIVSRWHGRTAHQDEIAQAMHDEPADDLEHPRGHLAVAYSDGVAAGIGGLRFVDNRTAELTKVFTTGSTRKLGVGTALLDHLEAHARRLGFDSIRLDTRSDLFEACRLYESRGYVQVAPFTAQIYSDRWYRLQLQP